MFFNYSFFHKQEKLEILLARAMYATDCPLSLFDNEYWSEFFKNLRPSWVTPSRYVLSNSLLDAEYERAQRDVHQKIANADSLGLQCDCWSNRRYVLTNN